MLLTSFFIFGILGKEVFTKKSLTDEISDFCEIKLIAGEAAGDRGSSVWAPAAAPAIDTDFSDLKPNFNKYEFYLKFVILGYF